MFTLPQPHSCLTVITDADRHGKNLTFGGCLTISLLFHLAVCSVVFLLKANAVCAPRKTVVVEIDLSRIEAASPAKASSIPARISGSKASANRHSRLSPDPIRTARPLQEKTSQTKTDLPPIEAGPGKETETKTAEMNAGGAESKRSGSGGGAEGKHSGSGGGEGNDRPAGNGQGARSALAEYSRAIRALIERNKEYPFAARRMGFQGSLILSFSVNRLGELRSVSLVKTSGNSMLDNAGLRAVRTAGRFPPPPRHAMSGAEEISFRIPITFALTGG